MKITKNKNNRSVALGIVLAWVCIISWAFYKEMDTKMIVLFFAMFFSGGLMPVYTLLFSKQKTCDAKLKK